MSSKVALNEVIVILYLACGVGTVGGLVIGIFVGLIRRIA